MTRQIIKAILAVIFAPFTLCVLLLYIPILIIAYLNHILDDDLKLTMGRIYDDLRNYRDEWKYVIDLYIEIFTFKKDE